MARLARLILEFEKLQLVVTVIAAAAPLCHVLMSRVMIVRAQSCHTVMSQSRNVMFIVSHCPAVCNNSNTIVFTTFHQVVS